MTTPLVVVADDFGLTAATAGAILEAHHGGIVTATSVLALAPGALGLVPLLEDAPDLGVGVHLALVGEDPPLLSAREIPTLVDARGRLAESWRRLLPRLALRRVDPGDLRRELAAQVDAVAAATRARHLTHLDSHQHLHLWPSVAAVVIDLAREHEIGRIRVPRPTGGGLRTAGLTRLAAGLDRRLGEAGIARTDRFRGIDEAGGWSAAGLEGALAQLADGRGSVELNVHPGAVSDPERGRYAWSYGWGAELAALTAPQVRDAVVRTGFTLAATVV